MALLAFFYKNGLWLSWPVFGLGVYLLWFFILTVVRLGDRNRLCSLPLEARQNADFPEAGRVILWMEGPLFSTRCRGLSFDLTGSDGSLLKGRMILFRQASSGFSTARITLGVFTIPSPGTYILNTRGLGDPRAGDEKHRLIFMRPYLPQTIGCILGIILGAFLAIGSTVNFFLRLLQGGDV
jgi:hypothetical protein